MMLAVKFRRPLSRSSEVWSVGKGIRLLIRLTLAVRSSLVVVVGGGIFRVLEESILVRGAGA